MEIQNFGLSASEPAEVEVICGGHSLGRMTLKTLQPYEVEYLAFSPDAALADDKSSYEVVFFMKEKRWNGTDSGKTDLICKLTVDNILFLSEKRLPNVFNKKMQNMKNLLTFCLMVCCVAVQAQLVTYPEGLQTGMSHNDDYTVRVRVPGATGKICLSIMCR